MTMLLEGRARKLKTRDATTLGFLSHIGPAWRELQDIDPEATVFSTWQWNAAAARHFVAKGGLNVLLVEDDGAPVALAPLAWRRHLGLKTLAFVGSGLADYCIADYQDFLIAPGRAEAALTAIVEELAYRPAWDQVWLQELPDTSRVAALLPDLARGRGWFVSVEPASETYTVALPPAYEDYLARLSQNTRKAVRRRWNKLEREHAARLQSVGADEDPLPSFEALIDLHTRRWNRDGRPGIFKRGTLRAFHRDAAIALHQAGMLDLTTVTAGDAAIAAQYALDFHGRKLLYTNGHDPAETWQPLSLGLLTDLSRVEAAIAQGMTCVDFGRSEGEYKQRYAPERHQNVHLRLFRTRSAYLRCRAYLKARESLKPLGKRILTLLRRRNVAPPNSPRPDVES